MKRLLRHYNHIIGILIGAFLGVFVGSLFPELGVNSGFLGAIFLNALKMIVLPLIIVSITLSIIKAGNIGSLGIKTLLYFLTTTAIAVFIGILIVTMIQPGLGSSVFKGAIPEVIKGKEGITAFDLLKDLISPNLFESAGKFQILPLIIAAILFGVAFAALGKENKLIVEILSLIDRGVMKIVNWIIIFTPIGVFGLIANRLGMAGVGAAVLDRFETKEIADEKVSLELT
jgi:Na+/H+-dicarboxylate symporter